MTLVQLVNPVRQSVGANRANIPTAVSKHLTPLERELEAVEGISLHQFNQPVAEVVGRVSVVTPTTASRARFHPQLWQCFVDQSWPDKELVVVETYDDKPSAFFQHIARVDSRLKYTAIKRPVGEDLTVGAKRNLTILLASGQYCVNFDDDDLYANRYVESMVTQMQQRNLVAWRCQVGTISSRLEALQDIRGPNHGIQKMKMKWMRSCMAMVLAMCTFEWWPCFIRIPIWPLRRTLLSCWNCGRRWERVVLDSWKILMAFACTSSTRAAAHLTPEISHRLTEEELDGLVVSECRAYDCFMDNYSTSFSWFTGIFTSLLFQFWSCWSDLRTCRSDQLIWLDFTNVRFHHSFCFNFTIFAKCSRKVGKETTAFESQKKNCLASGVTLLHWVACWPPAASLIFQDFSQDHEKISQK